MHYQFRSPTKVKKKTITDFGSHDARTNKNPVKQEKWGSGTSWQEKLYKVNIRIQGVGVENRIEARD